MVGQLLAFMYSHMVKINQTGGIGPKTLSYKKKTQQTHNHHHHQQQHKKKKELPQI
jgi:hypothetical protein